MTSEGLREQQKRRTHAALSAAAIGLISEGGIEAVTAEAVAARAGVSRRTFFNYFPRLEDVLTASIDQVTSDTIEELVSRPDDEPLSASVRAVLDDLLDDPVFEQASVLERAAQRSPSTRRFLLEYSASQEAAFEDALRRRVGEDADPVYVASLAAASAAIIARLTRLSVELENTDGSTTDAPERHRDRLRQAFDLLFSGFDETAATAPRKD